MARGRFDVVKVLARAGALAGALATIAGCAEDGGSSYGGDPGARPDSRGTQAKVEAATQGKKLPPAAQADVDRYNDLLNQYLGARCHV